ncbi:hypothetical protein AAF712_012048 [Marasmius tenuissimus]|uniref:Transposase n=1 Tax=Marasmius tenuissimus TaxID=585030 RepID=A0ABR2ZK78_9AGAR
MLEQAKLCDQAFRHIWSYSNKLALALWSCPRKTPELIARYTQAKADLEAQHDVIKARIRQLERAIRRLRPPTLILTRRVKVSASPEVEALIVKKADRLKTLT